MASNLLSNSPEARQLIQKLEALSKSFSSAGYPDANRSGRTGIAALAIESMDPVMHVITAKDEQMHMVKSIKKEQAKQSIHQYKVQNAIAVAGRDLSLFENGLPQEDQANWETVSEALKIYGIKTTLGDMVRMINDQSGYDVDTEKENEKNAIAALSQQLERDAYAGGDYYIDQDGFIDVEAPLRFNSKGPSVIRRARGVQANVREGDRATRGIAQDFVAYGNSTSVVRDMAGAGLDQDSIDDASTDVLNNAGELKEAHASPSQINEFRKTLFTVQRGDISTKFAVQGPDVNANEGGGFTVLSVGGDIKFIPCIYKNTMRQRALPIQGSAGQAPIAPAVAMAAPQALSTSFKAGDKVRFVVQAWNIHGASMGTQVAVYTILANGDAPVLTITNNPDAEYFMVFATPVAAAGAPGTEGFVGQILKSSGASTTFIARQAVIAGYESVLFQGADEDRLKMAVLGNLINRSELGRNGMAVESIYSSYFCFLLYKPRSCFIMDNVKQRRRTFRE